MLQAFTKRKWASKRYPQSLAGKLNWAAGVVYGGRVFLFRILNASCSLAEADRKFGLTPAVGLDVLCWDKFMCSFNGASVILDNVPVTAVYTDACGAAAGVTLTVAGFIVTGQ